MSPTTRGSAAMRLGVVCLLLLAAVVALGKPGTPARAFTLNPATVFINEIHYDNTGSDTGELIEVAGPAGTDLSGWSFALYNGNVPTAAVAYETTALSGTIPNQSNGFGTLSFSYPTNGIQNGPNDGVALFNGTALVQFLSYEGVITGSGGVADGVISTDIGVSQIGTEPTGSSLHLVGTGSTYQNFTWAATTSATPGTVNGGQTFQGGPALPTVTLSVSTGSASEAGATAVTVTATASTTVTGDQTVSIAVSGTGITAGDYTLSANTITIADGATSGSVTFSVVDDADAEGSETATLTISNPSAGIGLGVATSQTIIIADNEAAPDPCPAGPAITKISAIQGSAESAALTGARTVEGVVTQLAPGLTGIYLQEEAADQDGDSATSEGLFVFMGNTTTYNTLTAGLAAGDVVRVSGTVSDRSTSGGTPAVTSLNTQIGGTLTLADCGATAAVTPVDVSFPLANVNDLDRFENMLVRLPQELTISEYFNFDRLGEVVLSYAAGTPGLGGRARFFTPTNIVEPGAAANALSAEYAKRRIILDDGRSSQNPTPALHPNGQSFTLNNRFRGGDTITGVVGNLEHTFGLYRIQPTSRGTFATKNTRPVAPEAVGGRVRVAALNTLNFFLTLDPPASSSSGPCGGGQNLECRGANTDQPEEFTRQRAKLLEALKGINADVLGLIELENTPGVEPLGDAAKGIVPGLNAALGAGTYSFIDTGVIGSDAIRVGIIYKSAVVEPVGNFEILSSTDDSRFRDTLNRPVLAQSFREKATGEIFTVAVAHLKSKGSDCDAVGDPDAGDGQGNCNGTRTLAAQALVDWLNATFADKDFLIGGDLNSYAREDPIDAILAGPDGVAGNADDYSNLIQRFIGDSAYSYVFDGQLGYLDHALASASLSSQVAGASEWHINADEPDLLDYDTSFKAANEDALYAADAFRTSDHDPVIVGLRPGAADVPSEQRKTYLPLVMR